MASRLADLRARRDPPYGLVCACPRPARQTKYMALLIPIALAIRPPSGRKRANSFAARSVSPMEGIRTKSADSIMMHQYTPTLTIGLPFCLPLGHFTLLRSPFRQLPPIYEASHAPHTYGLFRVWPYPRWWPIGLTASKSWNVSRGDNFCVKRTLHGCGRLWLTALDSGVRDPIAIQTRWAVGLHRADLAALVAATCEVGTDVTRSTSARATGCAAHATNATPVIVPAAATNNHDQQKCCKAPSHNSFPYCCRYTLTLTAAFGSFNWYQYFSSLQVGIWPRIYVYFLLLTILFCILYTLSCL